MRNRMQGRGFTRATQVAVFLLLAASQSAKSEDDKTAQVFANAFELKVAGKLTEAAHSFESGLKAEPRNATAHYFLGETYAGLKQTDQAKAHLLRALELNPNRETAEGARKLFVALARDGSSAALGESAAPANSENSGPKFPQAGTRIRDCDRCPQMIVVPAGKFMMGSPAEEEGRYDNEAPQHLVHIAKPFAVGKFEVTFAEWNACVADGACAPVVDMGWGRGMRPVMNVNYDQAIGYTEWLSKKTGKVYRLLSESEWEYAARAGSHAAHFWKGADAKVCEYANVGDRRVKVKHKSKETFDCDDRYAETAPVGTHKANAFGLHDMLGNVWEWVQDCYNPEFAGAPLDGSAWTGGDCSTRVFRGGSWYSNPRDVRLAQRDKDDASASFNDLGFRVARALP